MPVDLQRCSSLNCRIVSYFLFFSCWLMKDNWNVCIVGEKVVLVPYRKEHVAQYVTTRVIFPSCSAADPLVSPPHCRYNQWMKDPYIRGTQDASVYGLEYSLTPSPRQK